MSSVDGSSRLSPTGDEYLYAVLKRAGEEVLSRGDEDAVGVDVLFAARDLMFGDVAAFAGQAGAVDLCSPVGRADLRTAIGLLTDAADALDTLLAFGE